MLATPDADTFTVDLPAAAAKGLKPTYNRLIHKDPGAALAGPAVNPNLAIGAIEAGYKKNAPGMTFFDNFLTPEAIEGLRRFCLDSTIWYEFRYTNGYLGAFMEDGFCCPLLLQVADEMRLALPRIFKHHTLRKLWAFKYDSRLTGIPMHADFAAVNVNFWITPDDANLDAQGGGLVVWDVEAPLDWDFAEYNRDGPRMRGFLEDNNAQPLVVPPSPEPGRDVQLRSVPRDRCAELSAGLSQPAHQHHHALRQTRRYGLIDEHDRFDVESLYGQPARGPAG